MSELSINKLKKLAKKYSKEHLVSRGKALDYVSKLNGYTSYHEAKTAITESQMTFGDFERVWEDRGLSDFHFGGFDHQEHHINLINQYFTDPNELREHLTEFLSQISKNTPKDSFSLVKIYVTELSHLEIFDLDGFSLAISEKFNNVGISAWNIGKGELSTLDIEKGEVRKMIWENSEDGHHYDFDDEFDSDNFYYGFEK